MSRRRWILVALLVVSTGLFAVAVIAERADADRHVERVGHTGERGEAAGEGAHAGGDEAGAARAETGESVLGVDVESTPLVVLAVVVGLGLAVLTATRFGQLPGVLWPIAVVALGWALLDVREVFHQAGESRTGLALVAAAVAVLHLATAAVAGRLAVHARRVGVGSPRRPGTLPA